MSDPAQRLARWRVRLGYPLGIVAFLLATPTVGSLAIGAAVGAAGEALRIWAAGHLEKGLEVTRTGPYALFSFDEPIANSSQLVLPITTPPASSSRITAVAS